MYDMTVYSSWTAPSPIIPPGVFKIDNPRSKHSMEDKPLLIIYLSQSDGHSTSSVVNRADRSIRQKQLPTRFDSEKARTKIYLQPCLEHDPKSTVTVKAEAYYYNPFIRKSISLGTVDICFFCRQTIGEPSGGWFEMTDNQRKEYEKKINDLSVKGKAAYAAKKAKRKAKTTAPLATQEVDDEMDGEEVITSPVSADEDDGDWLE